MTYTAEKAALAPSSDELRARIPGWGADLDPRDRPSVPRLQFAPGLTGAHWDFPERQPEKRPRERSIEHAFLTPVFGTSCPPRGISGLIRKAAYKRFSEADTAHWMLLIAADRVDSLGSSLTSVLRGHPDNPVTETGVLSESSAGGTSRSGRSDRRHHLLDPVIVAGPWAAAAGVAFVGARRLVQRMAR